MTHLALFSLRRYGLVPASRPRGARIGELWSSLLDALDLISSCADLCTGAYNLIKRLAVRLDDTSRLAYPSHDFNSYSLNWDDFSSNLGTPTHRCVCLTILERALKMPSVPIVHREQRRDFMGLRYTKPRYNIYSLNRTRTIHTSNVVGLQSLMQTKHTRIYILSPRAQALLTIVYCITGASKSQWNLDFDS